MKDDTISRQAAIDAFAPYAEYDSNRTNAEWVRRINMVLSALPSAQPTVSKTETVEDCISRQAAINLFEKYGAEDDAITLLESLPSTQPDAVTASLEELINDYGEDGFFIVDGVSYQANELLNELKTNSSVGKKFRKQITKTIVQYFMKFGG